MFYHYKLEGKTPVPVPAMDYFLWAIEHPDEQHAQVGLTSLKDDSNGDEITVSTVFLGIGSRLVPEAAPLLFETMVFGGTMHNAQWRYPTWEEAEAGHERVVQQLYREMPHLLRSEVYHEGVPTRFERILRSDP